MLRRVAEVLRKPAGVHKSRFYRFPVGPDDNSVTFLPVPALDSTNSATGDLLTSGQPVVSWFAGAPLGRHFVKNVRSNAFLAEV